MKIVYCISKGLYLFYHGYRPYCLLENFPETENIEEMLYDLAWDSDTAPGQGTDKKRFIVIEEELPVYIKSFEEYKAQWINIRYFGKFINSRKLVHRNLTVENYRTLFEMFLDGLKEQLYIIQKTLQVKKPRSQFKLSLINQIMNWLETPKEDRKYKAPLSWRQLQVSMTYESHNYHCLNSARVHSYMV